MDAADVAKIPLFAECTADEASRIAELFEEETGLPGRRPVIQGDFGYRFFVILDGSAVVRVDGQEVGELSSGDFFGEMALLDITRKRSAEVELTSKTRYASMMTWKFRELLESHPEIHAKVEAAVEAYRAKDETRGGGDA